MIITCNSDDFSYTSDKNGYVITEVDEAWCKRIQKCVYDEQGHQLGCDNDPNQAGCQGSCAWAVMTESKQRTYSQGASCKPGGEE
jgi:hypothetical protein